MNHLNKLLFGLLFVTNSMFSHMLWVNALQSKNYSPSSASVSIGWGHTTPIDDMLNSYNGKVNIKEFTLTSPDLKKINLRIPSSSLAIVKQKTKNFDIYDYDIALQKVAFKEKSKEGVYILEAKSKKHICLNILIQKIVHV